MKRWAALGFVLACVGLAPAAARAATRTLVYTGNGGYDFGTTAFTTSMTNAGATGVDVTSTWPSSLSTYRVVVISAPNSAFTTAAKDQMVAFVGTGGTLVLAGEGNGFRNNAHNVLNDILIATSRSSRFVSAGADAGCQVSSMTSAASTHAYTTGVSNLGYGYSGGITASGNGVLLAAGVSSQGVLAAEGHVVLVSDTQPLAQGCQSNDIFVRNLYSNGCNLDGDAYTSVACGGTDCNDENAGIRPNAVETCDTANVDEDCDGKADDADTAASGKVTRYLDGDNDGYGRTTSTLWCDPPSNYLTDHTDCNDANANISPGDDEECDPGTADEDCDGLVDDADSNVTGRVPIYPDADGDGFGAVGSTSLTSECDADANESKNATDCRDDVFAAHPGGTETCDATDIDQDCDGGADDLDPQLNATGKVAMYTDADGDGFGAQGSASIGSECDADANESTTANDCRDDVAAANPNGTEICDDTNVDQDCDGAADDADPQGNALGKVPVYADADGDGFGAEGSASTGFECDLEAYESLTANDCRDDLVAVHPNATETCDPSDLDQDCDGGADDADPQGNAVGTFTFYEDADEDGYGSATSTSACDPAGDFDVLVTGDCDDSAVDVNPGEVEICDEDDVDEDCANGADDADGSAANLTTFYEDLDGDGYGTASSVELCDPAGDFDATADGDCDDDDSAIHPGQPEVCDDEDVDEDCANGADDVDGSATNLTTFHEDRDRDGYGTDATDARCDPSGDFDTTLDGDCADDPLDPQASAIHPGQLEVCDPENRDEDCANGADDIDGSAANLTDFHLDGDGDGWGTAAFVASCDPFGDYDAVLSVDCDDADPTRSPGIAETPGDDFDEDCTGTATCYADADGDGARTDATTVESEDADCIGDGLAHAGDPIDCADDDDQRWPGSTEIVADGIDQDCDGEDVCYDDDDHDGVGDDTTLGGTDLDCDDAGESPLDGDCDDTDATRSPTLPEICDAANVDEDCDGSSDDADPSVDLTNAVQYWPDVDQDSYGDAAQSGTLYCDDPSTTDDRWIPSGTDCDDSSATVYPGADEVAYDGVDQDCASGDLVDVDGDGYPSTAIQGGTDCSDSNADRHPGAAEVLNGVDDDCDGAVDEGTDAYDDDFDGFSENGGDCDDAEPDVNPVAIEVCDFVDQDCDEAIDEDTECSDDDLDSYTELDGDCADDNPDVYPSAEEILGNGVDDDCDGTIDDGSPTDVDGDGYTVSGGDCDDEDEDVHPGATELENGNDDDCDSLIDEGTDAADDDGDGWSENAGDCDDGDGEVHPEAEETDNGADDDCDGDVDEGTPHFDDDGDGFTEDGGDCDDADEAVHPDAEEIRNGIDDDCDDAIDEGLDEPDTDDDTDTDAADDTGADDGKGCCDSGGVGWRGGLPLVLVAMGLRRRRA